MTATDQDDDPAVVFFRELEALYVDVGEPSLREVAKRNSTYLSPANLSSLLNGTRRALPGYEVMTALIKALTTGQPPEKVNGAVERFHQMWTTARKFQRNADSRRKAAEAAAKAPHTAAEDIVAQAQAQANRIVAQAQDQAHDIVTAARARTKGDDIEAAAQGTADRIVAQARAQAQNIEAEARTMAARIVGRAEIQARARARIDAEAILTKARDEADGILSKARADQGLAEEWGLIELDRGISVLTGAKSP